ncbi:unnamed protein product [Toxocara canis]|uniref:GYF domain-containing protein n=1 Tax=Toxocara canis TaxID=6265 RepID=A0A183UX45_TOXCA|nr:unnamed protein product [Toxocara canis]
MCVMRERALYYFAVAEKKHHSDADELLPAEAISRDYRSSNDGHCLSNNKRAERVNLPTREGRGWARRNPDSGNRFQGGFRQSNMHTSRKSYRPNEFVLPGTVGGVDTESRSGVSYSIGNGKGWGGRRPNERFGVTEEEPVQSVSSGRSLARGVDCYSSGGRKSQWRDGEKDLVQEWTHPPFLQYPYQLNGRGRERRHGDFKTEDASRAEAPNSQQGSRGPEWFRPKEDCRQRTVEADRFSSSTKSTNALSGEVRNRMVSTERRELSYVSVDARRWERDQQEWDHNSLTSHDSQVQAWKMSSSYSQTLDGTAASRDCNPSERLPVKSCAVVKAVENMNEEGELENRRMREDAINAGIESMNIVITGTTNTPSLKIDDVGVSVRNEATERERKRPDCSATWLLGEKYSNGSCEAVIDDLDKDSKIAAAVTDIDGQKGRGVHHHDLGHSNLDVSHSGQLLNAFADGDEETCRCTSNGIVSQITQFPDEIEATKQEQQRALGGEKLTMMKRLSGGSEGWGNVAMRQNSSARRINRMTTLLAPLALPSSVSKLLAYMANSFTPPSSTRDETARVSSEGEVTAEVEADRGRSNLRSACYHEPVERQLTASPEDESHGKRCATSSSQFQLNEGSPMPPIMSVHRRNIEVPRLSNYTWDETDVCTISTTSAEGKSMVRLDEVNKGLLTSTVMPYHLGSQSATADSWHESKSYTAAGTVAIPPVKFFNGTQQWRVGGNRGGRSASVRELCADSSDRRALLLKGELVTVTSEEPEAANSTPSSSERAVRDYASSVGKTHNSQSNKQERLLSLQFLFFVLQATDKLDSFPLRAVVGRWEERGSGGDAETV